MTSTETLDLLEDVKALLGRYDMKGQDGLLAECRAPAARVSVLDSGEAEAAAVLAGAIVISRAGGALRDPWCIRSGSLTGFSGGCHCVRCGSNFENLNDKYLGMDVVTTAVPSADAGSDASRLH